MGITGYEKNDAAAKATSEKEVSECLLPYSDSRQYIGQYVRYLWQREWGLAVHNKLHAIKPIIGGQLFTYTVFSLCHRICRDLNLRTISLNFIIQIFTFKY